MSEQMSLPLEGAPVATLAATDDLAREHAIDPRRSILLRAPAGSGKTTVLTQRLLCLLAHVDSPEEILAITFTRKAAAEMRERVSKALLGEIDAKNPQAPRLRKLADAVRARDAARGWGLLKNPGRLRIQTIDSFNYWLASQLPLAARAGGALVVAERPEELYRRAARRVLIIGETDEALAADIELLFERIDNRWDNVERLLAQMLAKRGHWLPHLMRHGEKALTERVNASLRTITEEFLASVCAQLPAALRNTASGLPNVGPLGAEADHMHAWKRLATLTLTKEDAWRVQITKALGEVFEHPAAKQQLKSCIDLLKTQPAAQELLARIKVMPAPALTPADAQAIEALSRVLRVAAAQLQVEFAAEGRVDYTYVAGAARQALVEAEAPTDLALRTGLELRHILIDEFQDTSLAQFELLEALTAGWEPGDGRTLFAVGDPMQSIYQFREAEVGLFLRARDEGIGPIRLESLQLTRNFRSAPALVEWTNNTCSQLFPPADDVRASAVAFTHSLPARAEQPGPAIGLTLFAGDRAAEAQFIARKIAEIGTASSTDQVAILVASRAHAPPIMAALEAAGIDAIGVDLVPLRDLSIVRDLVSLLRALHHLGDRTAWLAILRAPWCGVSLPTLTALSRRYDSLLLWEALADPERLARCEPNDRERLARVRAVLEEALRSRNRMPLSEWLEAVWLRLGGSDAYPREDLAHARAFFTALGDFVARGEWRGPQDIDAVVADLFAEPRARTANPVQVMTIHRAKGLEFDHVFLPALERMPNRDRDPLLRWLDLPRAGQGSDLLMAPVPAIGDAEGGELNAYLKRLMAARGAHEQARLLYVAMTRAKRSLHLTGAPKLRPDGTVETRAGTMLRCLWPVVGRDFEIEGEAAPNVDVIQPTPRVLRRLRVDWRPPVIEPAATRERLPITNRSLEPPQFSWVGETSRHIGTVVHAALERFASAPQLPTAEDIERQRDNYLHQLRRHGVPEKDLEGATRTVQEALIRTLNDERGRWIFSSEHRDARSELALTGVADGQLLNIIIDRTFVDASGTRWVIDFKTSRHEGGNLEAFLAEELARYRPQLERNIALARALGSGPVRAALYFPLLSELREL
ncbi:MAG TPA: UvrD-helicase domain-containing protein [Steroidobacteraceae bacterium]|nr:UvrD-helicase domain-containing protein [Steroidobacteraceae bacterium]